MIRIGGPWVESLGFGAVRCSCVNGWSQKQLMARRNFIARRRTLGLIRFRGHFPKGGYDVHNGRQAIEAHASEFQ